MALEKARNRKARTAALALYIPTWEDRPRTREELDALMSRMSTPSANRGAIRTAWATGAVVFFVGSAMLFGTRDGLLPRDWMTAQFDTALSAVERDLRALAQRLVAGEITLTEFRKLAGQTVEEVHWDAALLLFGPTIWTMAAVLVALRAMIDRQLAFLDRLVNDILTGKQRLDGSLLRRLGMYAGGGWSALVELSRRMALLQGLRWEQNVLGVAEHCEGCLTETARGKVPIGELVPIGERDCLSNCRCWLLFS